MQEMDTSNPVVDKDHNNPMKENTTLNLISLQLNLISKREKQRILFQERRILFQKGFYFYTFDKNDYHLFTQSIAR